MSAIVNSGLNPNTTPLPPTPIPFKSAINKFETVSQDMFFGPGMVTRFAQTFFKIVEIVDEHFYAKIQKEINGSCASSSWYPPSTSQNGRYYSSSSEKSSRANSCSLTDIEIVVVDGVQFEVSSRNSNSGKDPFPVNLDITLDQAILLHLIRLTEAHSHE